MRVIPDRLRRPPTVFAALAIVLWAGSLLLPALGARGGPMLSGLDVLFQGASGWRYGVLAWFGNPALLVAITALIRGSAGLALGAGATGLVLALSSFWTREIAALGGQSVPELALAAGFYLWLAAHWAALVGGVALWRRRRVLS
jgi:hypothetical protein